MIIYYNNTKHTKKDGQDFSHDDFLQEKLLSKFVHIYKSLVHAVYFIRDRL